MLCTFQNDRCRNETTNVGKRNVIPGSTRALRDHGCVDTPSPRHPGLVPGPNRKGRDLKTTYLLHFDSKIPDMRCAIPGRPSPRHPGLAPGPIQKGRELETTSFCTLIYKIPDIAGAIPGRRMGVNVIPGPTRDLRDDGCMDTSFPRHPGLVPGPWLVPGPFQRR